MPISAQVSKTPKGRPLLQLLFSGKVEGPEVEQNMMTLAPGREHAGKLLMVVFEKGSELTPDARKAAANLLKPGGPVGPVPAGIVTPSTPLRVLVNFLTRVVGDPSKVHVTATEADALKWLDEAAPHI